jgi:ribosomal-protein-alanine N-acetyltransferase
VSAPDEAATAHRTPPGAAPVAVEVVPMRRRHLRSVLRIERQGQGRGWSLGLFTSELSRPEGRIYLVAMADGAIVGFAGALLVVDEVHITNVAVDRAWRGRSVASRLVLELVRRALDEGVDGVTLEVRASNEAALALYRRFGLSPVGARKAYYSDPVEDALVMWATEASSPAYRARLDAIESSLPGAPPPGPGAEAGAVLVMDPVEHREDPSPERRGSGGRP